MSILKTLKTVRKAKEFAAQEPMTEMEVEKIKMQLEAEGRGFSVFPNKFDKNRPFRVAVKFNEKYKAYGSFTNVEVAAAVGTVVSLAYYGENAIGGEFDENIVENHTEWQRWEANPKNADVLERANGAKPCFKDEETE